MAAVASPAPGNHAHSPGSAIAPGTAAQEAGARGGGTCGDGVSIGAAADELEEEDADKLGDHAVDGDLACRRRARTKEA